MVGLDLLGVSSNDGDELGGGGGHGAPVGRKKGRGRWSRASGGNGEQWLRVRAPRASRGRGGPGDARVHRGTVVRSGGSSTSPRVATGRRDEGFTV